MITGKIVSVVIFTFLGYIVVGLPLAVLPGFVHNQLGYGSVLAGLVISVQYAATLLSRSHAGRMSDQTGPKPTVLAGLTGCAVSGLFLVVAGLFDGSPAISLGALLVSRLVLGFGESWVGTGATAWGIGLVGAGHTARVISWSGISTYGALALGAPLGVMLQASVGLAGLGLVVFAVGVQGFLLAYWRKPVAIVGGARMAFSKVVAKVLPHGMALALASVGFGSIATFITLYYASFEWQGAAKALTVFGCTFIAVRLVLGNLIARFGGFRIALVSISVETLGLVCLWLAPSPGMALAGVALAGGGFSLVYPSIGVEAVVRVPAGNRGAALGAYAAFLDLALGITGPVAGLAVSAFGYSSIYFFAAVSTLMSIGIVALLLKASRRARPSEA